MTSTIAQEYLDNVLHQAEGLIKPAYSNNDEAHTWDHALWVVKNAVKIIGLYGEALTYKQMQIIILGALVHDVRADSRKYHHVLAMDWVHAHREEFEIVFEIDDFMIDSIAVAALEHRASWDGGYSEDTSVFVAAADKGTPKTITDLMRASYAFARGHLKADIVGAREHSADHIIEKFGREGYLYTRSPNWIVLDLYKDILEDIWVDTDKGSEYIQTLDAIYDDCEVYYQKKVEAKKVLLAKIGIVNQ